jgi:hypothetical protein
MSRSTRGSRPSWQIRETWLPRPELWMVAAIALGVLLIEVWQTSRMAQLCLDLGQTRKASVQANARLDYMRAALERHSTRAELAPAANALGLAPADAQQMVLLPSEFLADDRTMVRDDGSVSLLALAERVLGALVPEATARSRTRS